MDLRIHLLSVMISLLLVLQPPLIECGTRIQSAQSARFASSAVIPATQASIQDFYINNTQTGNSTCFIFNVSDTVELYNASFTYDNGTEGVSWYTLTNTSLSGTNENVTFTINPFSTSTLVNFTFSVCNINSTLSPATTGYRTLAIYNTSMPYTSLGKAITALEGANSWTTQNFTTGASGIDPYQGLVLNQNTTAQYESVVDNMAIGNVATAYNSTVTNDTCSGYYSATGWTNPSKAFDNDTTTAAHETVTGGYGTSLQLTLSRQAKTTNIQYLVQSSVQSGTTLYIEISNDTSTWTAVASGLTPTWNSWTSISFSQSTFSYMDYFFCTAGSTIAYVNETQTWGPVGNSDYMTSQDYLDVLQYCAYSEKMNLTGWTNKQRDLDWALGNITMVGSLPYTDDGAYPYGVSADFSISRTWALYGYYYAIVYGGNTAQWNITAAYLQFDSAVNYSTSHNTFNGYGMPFWVWGSASNGQGITYADRYYDEDVQCIQDYLIFYSLLNVTDALTKAVYWWNSWLVPDHWSTADGGYFKYYPSATDPAFECEAGFFFKITSILKYYFPSLADYNYVLTDIGTRFLSNKWNSYQWLDESTNTSAYATVHYYGTVYPNNQTRMPNTLGAWQALLCAYLQMNSTYQSNMNDMLSGNTTSAIQPAWSLFLSSSAQLWNSTSKLFHATGGTYYGDDTGGSADTAAATSQGEITMFQLGLVPGTSTVAFPLEELNYEYTNDIDPVLMAFNLNQTARQVTIPVVQAGTITFLYGESPITQLFNESGIYTLSFTSSWNMISNVATGMLTSSRTVVGRGYGLGITARVADLSAYAETFDFIVYANATSIASQNVTVSSLNFADITFTWNTTTFPYGTYIISAYSWFGQNETNIANSITGPTVQVVIPGDVNGDGTVNILDAIQVSKAFLAMPSNRNWNPNADINGDGVVNILDAIIQSNNFLLHYP